jgi:hypothetical protein
MCEGKRALSGDGEMERGRWRKVRRQREKKDGKMCEK